MTDNELLLAISDLFDKKFDEKFDQKFDEKFGPIQQELLEIKQDILNMKQDILDMKQDIDNMKHSIDRIDKRLTLVELTLENEIIPNIRLTAEGHLDLNRKLDDALKIDSQKEMLMIRVNILESEVLKLKEQVSKQLA